MKASLSRALEGTDSFLDSFVRSIGSSTVATEGRRFSIAHVISDGGKLVKLP